jgi:RNA polymerase sigma factor (sigma-70 family)
MTRQAAGRFRKAQSRGERLWVRRTRQTAGLRANEAALHKFASEKRKEEFFAHILPLLQSLKAYIERRLRVAFLDMDIRTPLYTSEDILDLAVLKAYSEYQRKPKDLDLEQWLYQIANGILEKYLGERHAIDKRRRSLEGLTRAELRTLEEEPITTDAEGEIYLAEDLDDSELPPLEFNAPADTSTPEEELEKKEESEQLFRALAKIPVDERVVFELSGVEAFPDEAVAKIANIPPEAVPRIVRRVRTEILRQLQEQRKPSNVISIERAAKKSA